MAETFSDSTAESTPLGSESRGSQINHEGDPADYPSHLDRRGQWLSGILAVVLTLGIAIDAPSALLPWGLAAALSGVVGIWGIPLLRAWKTGQVIRTEGPQSHLKKAGTPTMGGITFVPVGIAVALVWTGWDPWVVAVSLLTLGCGLIGWLDDLAVIQKQSNKGLSPRQKLGLQLLFGILFCGWMAWAGVETQVSVPGLGSLALGWGFWPLALFVLAGTTNAVNLTDGMDGLAAGVVAVILVGMGSLALTSGSADPDLAIFALAMAGACIGFLAHNHNPAKVFMGDTGSLGLGGALAGFALLNDQLWALALMGALLVFETLSVVLQVGYFKYTKRRGGEGQRLFKMSPFHHHLELSGWNEIQVVGAFYGLTGILVLVSWWMRTHGLGSV